MRVFGCGAEPIQPDTMRAFVDKFARRAASSPRRSCPATAWPRRRSRSASSASTRRSRPTSSRRDAYQTAKRAEPCRARRARPPSALEFVELRPRLPRPRGRRLRRRRPAARTTAQVGEIWVKRPVASRAGYFRDAEATRRRRSAAAGCAPATSATWSTATSTSRAARRTSSSSTAATTTRSASSGWPTTCPRCARAHGRVLGARRRRARSWWSSSSRAPRTRTQLDRGREAADQRAAAAVGRRDVVIAAAGSLPKTSSGKLQRRKARQQYVDGALRRGAPSARTATRRGSPETSRATGAAAASCRCTDSSFESE